MSESLSERRMAENQVVFRQYNQQVQNDLAKLSADAAKDGHDIVAIDGSTELHFYCECSDDNCRERVAISLDTYKRIHLARDRFTIVCGHDVPSIEDVTETNSKYCVVTKHKTPPATATKLNSIQLNNT